MEHQQVFQEAENENSGNQDDAQNNTNQLHQNDENILGNILPFYVWDLVSERLPASGMRNMSNASPYFRSLLLPKRIHFLLPDILKPLSEDFEKEEHKGPYIFVRRQHDQNQEEIEEVDGDKEEEHWFEVDDDDDEWEKVKNVPNILKCRQVCKSWNKSVDQFIEDTSQPSFFNVELPSPNKWALAKAKYTYFGDQSWDLNEFMEHFEQTHSPLFHPPRNPFIGRLVALHLPDVPFLPDEIRDEMMAQVKKLLEYYGHHIRILNIGLPTCDDNLNHLWLTECLSSTPNLTHLKVCSLRHQTDMQFGEHIHQPNFGRALPVDPNARVELDLDLEELLMQLDIYNAANPNDAVNGGNPNNVGEVQLGDIEASPPLPSLKCLKLCRLPAVCFNPLIKAYRHVDWLHIETAQYLPVRNFVDWRQVEFPNLRTFYIRLHSPAEARQLWYLNPSRWGHLTSVHLEYCWGAKFFEWCRIFETIEELWGNTLVELKLRLPKPSIFLERAQARRDAVNCKLTLSNLKRLKIWICKSCDDDVPLTFLESVMQLPGLEFQRYDDSVDH